MTISFFITPVTCAVVGYFTNWLAIKMLFLPHYEKKLWGIKLPFTPGVLPKSKKRLARTVGNTVADYLLTGETIESAIKNSDAGEAIDSAINSLLDSLQTNEKPLIYYAEIFLSKESDPRHAIKSFLFSKLTAYLKQEISPLSEEHINMLKSGISQVLPEISKGVADALRENQELNQKLLDITKKMVGDSVGGLLGGLVYKKVYDNVKKSFLEFIEDPKNLSLEKADINGLIATAFSRINQNPENRQKLKEYTDLFIDKILDSKIYELVSAVGRQNMLRLKILVTRYRAGIMEKAASVIAQKLDIQQIVEDKINELSIEQMERIILEVAKKELNYITIMGGVLGFIIGLLPQIMEFAG